MSSLIQSPPSPLQLRDELETMVLKELLGPSFHQTTQGLRYTTSETAGREVLARLLKLNHERYAEEDAKGLHNKKGREARGEGRAKKTKTKQHDGPRLFGEDH
jgi:hypothetical protein